MQIKERYLGSQSLVDLQSYKLAEVLYISNISLTVILSYQIGVLSCQKISHFLPFFYFYKNTAAL